MTDWEYDADLEKLAKLDPDNSFLKDTGSEDAVVEIPESRKAKLPIPMHSYEKVYTLSEFEKFIAKYNGLTGSIKYDGAAILLEYKLGKLTQAYTKGRESVGQKALEIAQGIPSIPQTLPVRENAFIKCELVMCKTTFESLYADTFSNSRNMIAGLLNSGESSPILNNVTAIAHTYEGVSWPFMPKTSQLERLNLYGFTTVEQVVIPDNISADAVFNLLIDRLSEYKRNGEFPADGIIIEQDDPEDPSDVRPNGNPRFGIALKVQLQEDMASTTVTNIEWNMSKFGILVPRVTYEPVELNGTTCTHTSGFNYEFIKNSGLGIGSEISLQKAGDIIPNIISVNSPGEQNIPTTCPSCGKQLVTVGVNLRCPNMKKCTGSLVKKADAFFRILGVKSCGEKILAKIFDNSKAESHYDILKMKVADLENAGLGPKQALNLYKQLDVLLQDIELSKFMHATGIFEGLGSTKLKLIVENVKDYKSTTLDELHLINGIGDIQANIYLDNLSSYKKIEQSLLKGKNPMKIVKKVKALTKAKIKTTPTKYADVYVFSGFRDAVLQETIESSGGRVSDAVSSKISAVIVKDLDSKSSKVKKAKELNIPIIKYEDFIAD